MKIFRINYRGLYGACILALFLFGTVACQTAEEKKAILKGADYAEICNLMSLHSWYHAAFRNDLECENIWVSPDGEFADTAIWAQQAGYWKGMDHIMANYGAKDSKGHMPDPEGGFVWHTITTPVVEIAEDRQTAKGIWYTPGIVGEYTEDGTNSSQWMWEKYAVEFVRENGEWKIWHMKVYTDFSTSVGEAIGTMGAPPGGATGGAPGGAPPQGMMPDGTGGQGGAPGEGFPGGEMGGAPGGQGAPGGGGSDWDYVYKDAYQGWSKDSVVKFRPRAPEPYKTFSETWSYMDEGE